jgi:hypothetical protein
MVPGKRKGENHAIASKEARVRYTIDAKITKTNRNCPTIIPRPACWYRVNKKLETGGGWKEGRKEGRKEACRAGNGKRIHSLVPPRNLVKYKYGVKIAEENECPGYTVAG